MEKLLNYYQLLHVQPDAPAAVIKASYRAMMQKMRFHPDLGGDESLAQQLNEAVATLCHVDRRLLYDQQLESLSAASAQNDAQPTGDSAQPDKNTKRSKQRGRHHSCNPPYARANTADCTSRVQFPGRSQCPFCHATYSSKGVDVHGYEHNNRCAQCKGASNRIENVSLGSADDIRRIYRHTHQSDVRLYTQWPVELEISAVMTDLSIAGCAINCTQSLPIHAVIMMDTQLLNSLCQVRYQKQLGSHNLYSIGLEFLTLDIVAGPGSVFSATA